LAPQREAWRLTPGRAVALAAVLAAVFLLLAWAVATDRLEGFDAVLSAWIRARQPDSLTVVMRAVTGLGSPALLVPLGLLTSAWVWGAPLRRRVAVGARHARYGAFAVLVALGGSWVLNTLLKFLFQRTRPDLFPLIGASGWAFPSGHSMTVFAFYATTAYVTAVTLVAGRPTDAVGQPDHSQAPAVRAGYPALTAAVAVGVVLLVGLSRVYLGVHYPSDVVAGYAAGGVWALLTIAGFEKLRHGR